MKLNSVELYQVTEGDDMIVIHRASDKIKQGVIELIKSDLPTCCEYLARYVHERLLGKHIRDAHTKALKGARIITPGTLDQPGIKVNGS